MQKSQRREIIPFAYSLNVKEPIMGMRGRKRKDRRKKAANHGKRPNA
ncbi:hypothetical protein FHX77_000557 [Bifidobacterium commune]|nr:hypothetical protein [Bifidobacterium commune]